MSATASLRRAPPRHKAHNDAVLDVALCDATISTFAHYDVALTPVGPSPALRVASHYAVGVIGFSGEGLRGTLVIATCTALVTACSKPAMFSTRSRWSSSWPPGAIDSLNGRRSTNPPD